MARICFFARVANPAILDRVEFYVEDLAILRELGHDVIPVTRVRNLVRAEIYFCWWWTWAFAPLLLARLLGKPVIVTGVFDEWKFDSRPWPMRWLLRFALRAANVNIFISEFERDLVPRRFVVRRPRYSPCVVDTDRYFPAPVSARERFLLTVAWLETDNARRKGIPELLRAMALVVERHADARWVHCGEKGTGFPDVERLAGELGIAAAVEFRGVVSVEEKRDLMQRCGAYVQPSHYEGFGLAVLEAMSCGAPVVASRGGALPEVVGDAGILLEDLGPRTIADQVCALLEHPDTAAALGTRARARALEHFARSRRRADIERALADLRSERP